MNSIAGWMKAAAAALLLSGTLCASGAAAHDGHQHGSGELITAGLLPPGGMGGEFDLTDQDGRQFRIGAAGHRYTLLFFGLTRCSSVCPTALAEAQRLVKRLPARQVPRVVFVTLDPERDTPEALKKYVGAFNPEFIGLTGSVQQIADVAAAYKVGFRRVSAPDGYTVEHSAFTYLLDERGRVARLYRFGTSAEVIASELKQTPFIHASLR
jgi:protein SCO1/2